MLMPKRVKHRKQFRGSMSGKATRGNTITYGEYGGSKFSQRNQLLINLWVFVWVKERVLQSTG